jgi:hypothetical protein
MQIETAEGNTLPFTRRQRQPLDKEGPSQFVLAFLSSLIKTTPLPSSGKWLLACKEVARLIQTDVEQLGNSWRRYKWH